LTETTAIHQDKLNVGKSAKKTVTMGNWYRTTS